MTRNAAAVKPVTLVFLAVLCVLTWGAVAPARPAIAQSGSGPRIALIAHDLPAGTDAGSNPGGAWTTRPLNTEVYDPDGIVTLAGNQFTLAAGEYLIESVQSIFGAHGVEKSFRGRIRNVTAATTVSISLNVRVHVLTGESAAVSCPTPPAYVSLAAPATFELQFFCQNAHAVTEALGLASNAGVPERYAYVVIRKM